MVLGWEQGKVGKTLWFKPLPSQIPSLWEGTS